MFDRGKLVRAPNHPANMTTSLMAEVMFSKAIPPTEILGLVFPSLASLIRYESLHGGIPKSVEWKTDKELSTEDRLFSFWKDVGSVEAYEWLHQFSDHQRLIKPTDDERFATHYHRSL